MGSSSTKPYLPPLFDQIPEDDLIILGVPPEYIPDVRAANDENLLWLVEELPQEAAEALLDLAAGDIPKTTVLPSGNTNPFDHPDAQRRFRVLTNVEALERALDYPWEKWTIFLHPTQRQIVEQDYKGPARISGSAGTGKSIVALHRAVHLARHYPKARVLLTTFSETLANALKTKLERLVGNEPKVADRIVVRSICAVGKELYADVFGESDIVTATMIRQLLDELLATMETCRFTSQFLFGEWSDVVDSWQLKTWEDYRDVPRLGRKTRMGGKQREILWSIFEQVRSKLTQRDLLTWSDMFGRVTNWLIGEGNKPFDFAVVDEAQDLGVPAIRFLSALAGSQPNALFFSGDLGQRIFQQPFSWRSLGIDVRGRSHTLRINYRTSHQIRSQADKLLPSSLSDVDGHIESRRGIQSVFNGPVPEVRILSDEEKENTTVTDWISKRLDSGFQPHEIGLFVRSQAQIDRARDAVETIGFPALELGDTIETQTGKISISTMHLAKGLEFRAVVVMACDDEVLPLQERIESISDDSDLEEVYNTERYLLYVACTRARDHLLVTGIDPGSEFLDDFDG